MNELNHTPLPWHVCKGDPRNIRSGNDTLVAACCYAHSRPHENAEFIVRAVTAHAPLMRTLESAYRMLRGEKAMGATEAAERLQEIEEVLIAVGSAAPVALLPPRRNQRQAELLSKEIIDALDGLGAFNTTAKKADY